MLDVAESLQAESHLESDLRQDDYKREQIKKILAKRLKREV